MLSTQGSFATLGCGMQPRCGTEAYRFPKNADLEIPQKFVPHPRRRSKRGIPACSKAGSLPKRNGPNTQDYAFFGGGSRTRNFRLGGCLMAAGLRAVVFAERPRMPAICRNVRFSHVCKCPTARGSSGRVAAHHVPMGAGDAPQHKCARGNPGRRARRRKTLCARSCAASGSRVSCRANA